MGYAKSRTKVYERLEWKAGKTCEGGLESATFDCLETGENADSRLWVYEGCLWDVDRRMTFGDVLRGGKAGVMVFGGKAVEVDTVSVSIVCLFTRSQRIAQP